MYQNHYFCFLAPFSFVSDLVITYKLLILIIQIDIGKKYLMSAFHILVVEDNEADILLTTELLVQVGINHSISVARDGVEAIDYVLKRGKYTDAVTPNLILLDINLPKASGTEVLSNIKNDDKYKKIPVIIYTSSFLEADRIFCESLGANLYLTKANTMTEFSKRIEDFKNFLSMIL